MHECGVVQNVLHPEIIFESSHFAKMKMIEKGKVLAQIIHGLFLESDHVLYLLKSVGKPLIETKGSRVYKISCEQERIALQIEKVIKRQPVVYAKLIDFIETEWLLTPDPAVSAVSADVQHRCSLIHQ